MLKKVIFWLFIFLIFGQGVAAANKVVLYKFSSYQNSGDWVEIKNNGTQVENLAVYRVEDGGGHGKGVFLCLLRPGGIFHLSLKNYLNWQGDIILLKREDKIVDCVAYGTAICPGKQAADLPGPTAGQAGVLTANGWQLTTDTSSADNTDCLSSSPLPSATPTIISTSPTPAETSVPTPSPSPSSTLAPLATLTSTPSPTPTPAPKAICHLLIAKDESGREINNAKIYIDGQYIHHYLPETLHFCPGCYCDPDRQVACHLGQHQINIRKDGYQDWQWTNNFVGNNNYQQQPMLQLIISPTPSLAPTPLLLPSAMATVSDILRVASISSEGEVKGAQVSSAASRVKNKKVSPNLALPLIFVGSGVTMIGSYFILKNGSGVAAEKDW